LLPSEEGLPEMLTLVFDTPEERDKFVALYEDYGKIIYYTLSRFGLDEYTIEDLSQDIYMILANHLADIDLQNYKRTRNYIITITRNYCKNHLRSKSRKPEESLEKYPDLDSNSDGILDQVILKEQISRLSEEIGKLDDIYKCVLELKYVNGFANDEIASILNIKKKTVEMRLYRANQILRTKLRE
jgi:RNA polymerase sigma-70 factor (ECF subfamily)